MPPDTPLTPPPDLDAARLPALGFRPHGDAAGWYVLDLDADTRLVVSADSRVVEVHGDGLTGGTQTVRLPGDWTWARLAALLLVMVAASGGPAAGGGREGA